MRSIHPIIELANAAFPNLEVGLGDEQLNRSIISRRIGRYAVMHLKMPAIAVELIGQRAVAVGLGNHLKLIWHLMDECGTRVPAESSISRPATWW